MIDHPPVDVVESFLADFEAAWAAMKVGNSQAPRIEDYLPPPGHPAHLAILIELACIDLERSWEQGRRPEPEAYFQRFPILAEDADGRGQLAFEDYRQRLLAGLAPRPEDYRQRFDIDVADWPLEASAIGNGRSRSAGSGFSRGLFDKAFPTRRVPVEVIADLGRTRTHRQGNADRLEQARARLPQVGQDFLGFQLLHELGRGAFGIVFLARQGDLANRLVALKVSADWSAESDRLAQLQHTNIVPIYSAHRSGPLQAICMPYFGCATVADLCRSLGQQLTVPTSGRYIVSTMRQRQSTLQAAQDQGMASGAWRLASEETGPQPLAAHHLSLATSQSPLTLAGIETMTYVNAVLWLGARLADGLAHAHDRGIIHRDLKPANILLTDDGQPMLLDFNLADDLKQRPSIFSAHMGGTLPYMSPEQLASFHGGARSIDARSDVYAMGLILFQLLTGRLPFPLRKGPVEQMLPQMLADRQGAARPVRPCNSAVSPAAESIILHCLEADPERRYASARQLKEDIDRHLADLPLRHAPEPSWAERAREWARRHPRLASPLSLATAGAAFLLLAVCLTVALSLDGRQRQLDARRETALTQYAAFEHSFREAEVLLEDDYAEQIREGVDAGLKALASFGVLDHPDWAQRSPAVDLPPGDRERLTREVGELAFLVAEGSVFLEGESPADKAQGRLLRQLAAACLGPEAAPLLSSEAATETFRRLHDRLQSTEPAENGLSFLLASLHTRHGHYREALPILDRLIQAAPKQYACWYLKGRCHEGLGQAEDALRCYSTCIVIRPDFARPYMARAAVTINHHCDLGRHLTLARADLDEALRLNPRQTTAHIDRSMVLAAQGCLPEALADLDWVLSRPQPPTRVFFLRASVRERLGDAEGARRDRDEGMKRQPTDSLSWITRGVERMARDPNGALADLRQGEKLTPNSFHALNNQAVILGEMQKKHREALAVLDRLVERQPDILVARAARGVLRARLGLSALALADAKTCLATNPRPEINYRAACIYALAANGDSAMLRESQRLLALALLGGWGFDYVTTDDDLAPLRKQPGFTQMLDVVRMLHAWQQLASDGKHIRQGTGAR